MLRGYAAVNERDFDAALEPFAPDAEHDWSRSMGPYAGVYRGRRSILRFWRTFLDAVESLHFDAEEVLELEEHVLVMVAARIRGRESGVEVVARGPHLWTFRDGKVVRFTLFQTREEVLHAVEAGAAAASTGEPSRVSDGGGTPAG